MGKNNFNRMELEEMIVKKSLQDEDFKKLLLTNPHEAIAQLNVEIPKEMEIKILEETANTSYLVLPYIPEELSDDALDLVAGGSACSCNYRPFPYNSGGYSAPSNCSCNRQQAFPSNSGGYSS